MRINIDKRTCVGLYICYATGVALESFLGLHSAFSENSVPGAVPIPFFRWILVLVLVASICYYAIVGSRYLLLTAMSASLIIALLDVLLFISRGLFFEINYLMLIVISTALVCCLAFASLETTSE